MRHSGQPVEGRREGCTAGIWSVQDAAHLHHRGVTFAVLCEGPGPGARSRPSWDSWGYRVPWYSTGSSLTNETTHRGVEVIMTQAQLLDLTVFGRQER
ncbi:hypothetical protein [Isoptericola nanjingensis]|uniref:hypothetical protein n=1 Tax=Isoptericola nanjingensis TaxID=903413 RepID=UPI003D21D6FB